jgi:orotidine-5'-phosphate decarboxylase
LIQDKPIFHSSPAVDHLRRSLRNRICLALDEPDIVRARSLLGAIGERIGMVKVGPVLFMREGMRLLDEISDRGIPLFLDLKWHDIPNTVFGAISGLSLPTLSLLTVHAQGGEAMIRAAREASENLSGVSPLVLAVTLLTHLDSRELDLLGIPDRQEKVLELGGLALASGAHGLVMAPGDLLSARGRFGPAPYLVTPGIRWEGGATSGPKGRKDDQVLAGSPKDALLGGSDLLVIGRPFLNSPDPKRLLSDLLGL